MDIEQQYREETGRRIRAARRRKGWTLLELETAIHSLIKKNALNNYELGKRTPGVIEAIAIAKATDDSAAYLLCVAEEDELKKQELDLLRNFRVLNERDRNDYARRIATMAMMHREPVPDERVSTKWKVQPPSPIPPPKAQKSQSRPRGKK